jgi:hypothetical protein
MLINLAKKTDEQTKIFHSLEQYPLSRQILQDFYMVKSVMSNKSVRLIGHLHMGDNLSYVFGMISKSRMNS